MTRKGRVAVAVVAILLTVLAASLTFPEYGEICEQPQDAQQGNYSRQDKCATYDVTRYALFKTLSWLQANDSAVAAFATVWIAVFTIVLAVATIRLWNSTADLARFSEEQSMLTRETMIATTKMAHATEWAAKIAGGANKLAVENAERREQELKILQRAYVWVDLGNIRSLTDEDGFVPRIIIRNAGNLPARNVSWVFGEPYTAPDGRWKPSK